MASTHPKLIKNVVEQTPRAMIAMLVVSTAYGIVFFKFIPMSILAIWFSSQILLAFGRIFNAKIFTKHLKSSNEKGLYNNEVMFVLLNVFQAFTWTVSSLLIMTYAPQPFEMVSFVIIIGIITAAALSMSSLYRAYLIFFFLMITPQIIIMLYYGEHQHIGLVIFTLIYIPAIILLSKSMLNSRMLSILAHEEIERSAKEFQKLSTIDNLTSIYNRRYFFEMSKTILLMAHKEQKTVSMLMLDVDHFKAINDNFGHQAGDHVLVNLTKNIESLMRKNDLFARVGGEEFAVLLNNTGLKEARLLAERIRATVEDSTISYNSSLIKVTVSIGLAELSNGTSQIEKLYMRADKNLYKAKKKGRNQCYPPAL